MIDRLTKISQTNGLSLFYSYDSKNRISEQTFKLNAITNNTGYIYGDQKALNNSRGYKDEKAGLIYGITVNATQRVAYEYDYLNRLSSRTLNTTNPFTTKYDFIAGSGTNTTTTLLAGITNGSNAAISYTYDDNGNIETISENGVEKVKYYYDELNQLVREDNKYLAETNYPEGKTIVYFYDVGGNFRSGTSTPGKKEYAYTSDLDLTNKTVINQHTYSYDTNWKDKLTSFDGKSFTYDAIGNPTNFDGKRYEWQNGRQLNKIYNNNNTVGNLADDTLLYSYKYNDSGIRTQKTVNGITTDYYLDGDKVIFETNSINTLYYNYDENGDLIGFNLKNSTYPSGADFYYIRNGQSDIIGILDSTGAQVVSYLYDSWGKLISILGKDSNGNFTVDKTNDTTFIGYINPYRYRGYRYDTETELFYVGSRYYNPEIGRFLNSDGAMGINDDMATYNLYAYCGNNPVNRYDNNGMFWKELISGATHVGNTLLIAVGIDTAKAAFFLMMEEDGSGNYHARQDCWQQFGGYNGFYDSVFDFFTNMLPAKFPFSCNGTQYMIWAWKGDYINLGAGAELGIYYGGGPHWLVDTSQAMPMCMGLMYEGTNILWYAPSEKQWWITGFNPAYQNKKASQLTAVFGINFNSQAMYDAFYGAYKNDPRIFAFIPSERGVVIIF